MSQTSSPPTGGPPRDAWAELPSRMSFPPARHDGRPRVAGGCPPAGARHPRTSASAPRTGRISPVEQAREEALGVGALG